LSYSEFGLDTRASDILSGVTTQLVISCATEMGFYVPGLIPSVFGEFTGALIVMPWIRMLLSSSNPFHQIIYT